LNAALAVLAHPDLLEGKRKFEAFKVKFNKSYKSADEESMRYKVFLANLAKAEQLTQQSGTATFGVTKFSDMTAAEFKSKVLMNVTFDKSALPAAPVWQPKELKALPSSFDWNSKGIVTPVKNQEQCGSCWAFSATETVESVWAKAGNALPVLAPQQIVDCDTTDDGCDGGWPYDAYQYLISAGGQDTESSYPYTAEDGTCESAQNTPVAKITSWQYITQNENEDTMQQYVYTNSPISICVDAEVWQTYTGGVITGNCGQSIDHCVQITGWSVQTDSNGKQWPVWNIRNSWGASWGEQGYIWVARGGDHCALAQVVTVPCVNSCPSA